MNKLSGKELANAFGDAVNNYNFNQEEFVKEFAKQHRTLQQTMMRTMLACVEKAAEPDYGRDGRNQGSHDTAKLMVKGWKVEMGKNLVASGDSYWTEDRVKGYINNPEVKPSNLAHV
tara:strand:+ start:1735 stop:2085 length:351 start_codon:yes stop_codon:yes gene_type:complete